MSRPVRPSADRWLHPEYRVGYCQNRNGVVYTCVGSDRRSTGLRWTEKNKREGLRLLKAHIADVQNHSSSRPQSWYAVLEDYLIVHKPKYVRHLQRAVTAYLPDDVPFTVEHLQRALVQSHERLDHFKPSTVQVYRSYMAGIFAYAIKRGWIERSPLNVLPNVKNVRKEVFVSLAPDVVDEILKRLPDDWRPFFTIVAETGARAQKEIAPLVWSQITDTHIHIAGKGGRDREFPLRPFPRLRQVIEELREQANQRRQADTDADGGAGADARLFPHYEYGVSQTRFYKAVREVKKIGLIAADDRIVIHTLRSSAEWKWENVLGLDVATICDLAGHTIAIREQYYRKRKTSRELEQRIMNAATEGAAAIAQQDAATV